MTTLDHLKPVRIGNDLSISKNPSRTSRTSVKVKPGVRESGSGFYLTLLASSVTAVWASALPFRTAPVCSAMFVLSRMFP